MFCHCSKIIINLSIYTYVNSALVVVSLVAQGRPMTSFFSLWCGLGYHFAIFPQHHFAREMDTLLQLILTTICCCCYYHYYYNFFVVSIILLLFQAKRNSVNPTVVITISLTKLLTTHNSQSLKRQILH